MKNFNEIKKGDTIFLIEIIDSEVPSWNSIKELEVISVECVKNTCHMRILLSDNTLITPNGIFTYHSIDKSGGNNNTICDINEEVYSTDKSECIRIATNVFKIKMKAMQRLMNECKEMISKLDKGCIHMLELKINSESEVVTEEVIV